MTEPLADWFVKPSKRTPFGPLRNLYANEATQRFLFWSSEPGRGWSIGPDRDSTGSHQNSRNGKNISKFSQKKNVLISDQEGLSEVCEPWQETWTTGVTVECKGNILGLK